MRACLTFLRGERLPTFVDLARPQPAGVDDVLRVEAALVGDDVPWLPAKVPTGALARPPGAQPTCLSRTTNSGPAVPIACGP